MTWWEMALIAFGYLFGAGFAATAWKETKEYDGESIFFGAFWPISLVVVMFFLITMIPIMLGVKTFEFPQWKRDRAHKQALEEQKTRKELDRRIAELEKETGIT